MKPDIVKAKAKAKKVSCLYLKQDDIAQLFMKHYPALVEGKMNMSELARACGISRPTVYNYIRVVR